MPEIRAKRICHTFCNTQCDTGYVKAAPTHHSALSPFLLRDRTPALGIGSGEDLIQGKRFSARYDSSECSMISRVCPELSRCRRSYEGKRIFPQSQYHPASGGFHSTRRCYWTNSTRGNGNRERAGGLMKRTSRLRENENTTTERLTATVILLISCLRKNETRKLHCAI